VTETNQNLKQQHQQPFYSHYTDQHALAGIPANNWGGVIVGAKFYSPHALADGH